MRSRLFIILSAISLLICLASAALWVRSYIHPETLLRNRTYVSPYLGGIHTTFIASVHGGLSLFDAVRIDDLIDPDSFQPAAPQTTLWKRSQLPREAEYPITDFSNASHLGDARSRVWQFHAIGFAAAWREPPANAPGTQYRERWLVIPWPAVAGTTALPALVWTLRSRRRRRSEKFCTSTCRGCGYSLIGNTSGVCPECATAVANSA